MRVRFTVGRAMCVVAVVALAAAGFRWGVTMRARSRSHGDAADLHDIKREYAEIRAKSAWRGGDERGRARKASRWHEGQRDRHRDAAVRPWLDVPEAGDPGSLRK